MSVLDLTKENLENKMPVEVEVKELQDKVSFLENKVENLEDRLTSLTELFSAFLNLSVMKVSPSKVPYVPKETTHLMFSELNLQKGAADLLFKKLNNCKGIDEE